MTATTGTTAPLLHLTGYNAANLVRGIGEIARTAATVWVDALARPASPVDVAARGALWWSTMLDRRRPAWHLPNEIALSTPIASLRDFSDGDGDPDVVPTLVLPPQAGHSSTVVDFSPHQSQIAVIRAAGLTRAYALEWRPATRASRGVTVTDYLEVIDRSIHLMGGRANVVGDCQGGWLAAIYAALHPERVHTLTLAGAPIDFHAGESVIASSTRALTSPFGIAPYRALVAAGGGNMAAAVREHHRRGARRALPDLRGLVQAHPGHPRRVLPVAGGGAVLEQPADLGRSGDRRQARRPRERHLPAVPARRVGRPHHASRTAVRGRRAGVHPTGGDHDAHRAGGHLGLFMGRDALREDWPALMEAVAALSSPTPPPRGRRRRPVVADPGRTPRVPAP